MAGMMKRKFKKWTYIILGFIFGLILTFVVGTFYPNFYVVSKLQQQFDDKIQSVWEDFGIIEPAIEYSNNNEFVLSVSKCIQWINLGVKTHERIDREIIIAMAVLETGYGKSRFANEGNNLFGIRTWDDEIPQLKPLGNPDVVWGVRVYKTKCQSVQDMISTINRHPAYELFRIERAKQLETNSININKQIDLLNKWSTNPDYTKLIKQKVIKIKKILENG